MDASLLLKYPYVKKPLGHAVKPEEIFDGSYRNSRNWDPPPVFAPPTVSVFPPAVGGPAKGGGSWRNGAGEMKKPKYTYKAGEGWFNQDGSPSIGPIQYA